MEKVIRVFPRKTIATPTDDGARIGVGPGLFDEADRVDFDPDGERNTSKRGESG